MFSYATYPFSLNIRDLTSCINVILTWQSSFHYRYVWQWFKVALKCLFLSFPMAPYNILWKVTWNLFFNNINVVDAIRRFFLPSRLFPCVLLSFLKDLSSMIENKLKNLFIVLRSIIKMMVCPIVYTSFFKSHFFAFFYQ